MKNKKKKIDTIFEKITKNKQIHEAILLIENTNGDFSYSRKYGDKDLDTPILMASITKLFTTTCILILQEQGKLSLNDKITKYFREDVLHKLHVYKGKEYSLKLTIADLLYQTSGLPDVYEEGSKQSKKRAIKQDMQFNFNEKITLTKQLKPHFPPNKSKRAHYSDVNFDMLGKVIEKITQLSLEDIYTQFICDPLELKNTYLLKSEDDYVPTVYYKDTSLYRPKFIKSSRASGGAISTTHELMIFLKAFFNGKLFSNALFIELKTKRKLQASMFPIHYGAGYMVIPLYGLMSLFMGKGELIGHSGSTGSFAFYYPLRDLFIVGDVNQMANPALPIRLSMRIAII